VQIIPSTDWVHTILDIVTPIVIGIGSLIIRNVMLSAKLAIQKVTLDSRNDTERNINKLKTELVETNTTVKEELTKHNSDITQELKVHKAEDSLQFDAIRQTLNRIESKL
jgi:hypothetical protein